ncbi:MAG: hypothetical protein AAF902_05770 [Chloroflexota bacterium]
MDATKTSIYIDALIDSLNLEQCHPLTLEGIVKAVEDMTHWSISITKKVIKSDGMYFKDAASRSNHIIINLGMPRTKELHVIFHELGHIVFGHPTLDAKDLLNITADEHPVLCRYKPEQSPKLEYEAESFAIRLSSMYRSSSNIVSDAIESVI